ALLGPEPERACGAGFEEARGVRVFLRQRTARQFPIERDDMFGRRAITVFSILCADTVAILGDFSCQPAFIRKRSDQIAYQLRLADAAFVPADHDQVA